MIKCVNCEKEAVYTKADPGANPLDYCAICLPTWLRDRALLGHFKLREEPKAPKKKAAVKAEDESN